MDRCESFFQASVLMSTLATIARDRVEQRIGVDAIVVFPGVGERERIDEGIALAGCIDATVLFIAGVNAAERTRGDIPSREEIENRLPPLEEPPWVEIDEEESNTLIQSRNTMALCARLSQGLPAGSRITLYLVVTDWHMLRAYLTLVRVLLDWHELAPVPRVYPWSAPRHIGGTVRGTSGSCYADISLSEAVAQEYQRILTYQQKGDVATYVELLAYLQRADLFESDAG